MEKLTEQGYNDLVLNLVQSQNLDKDLKVSHQNYFLQNGHWVYYQMLFRTIEKIRKSSFPEKDSHLINALAILESKLYDHTNIIPTDLPDWIVNDRRLIIIYFTDHSKISTSKEAWSDFQQHIQDKLAEIPEEMKVPFLEWCVKMLNLNLTNHDKTCTQIACGKNSGYERQIQFISKLIEETTASQTEQLRISVNQSKELRKPLNKIQWLGNQKELAELFVELKKKGWIEKFENETIQDCFTESNSIPQYLKPATDRKTKSDTYEKLYLGYTPLFYDIKENPKRHK